LKDLVRIAVILVAGWSGGAGAYPTSEDLEQIRSLIYRQTDSSCRAAARDALFPPLRIAFLGLVVLGDEVVQEAQLTDRRGAVWLAYYAMQRQKDGSWRVATCHRVQPARAIPA
jgi:hypothetical protein